MRKPISTGKIIPAAPALISITLETVPRACTNQRDAIAITPGKIGPKNNPTSRLTLKLTPAYLTKAATTRPLIPPPRMER